MSIGLKAPGAFRLPGGLLDPEGKCHREGRLRPLTGRDEEWLFALPEGTPEPVVVTELLTRCVERIGPRRPTREALRDLTIGDRDYLVLALRRATFGDKLALVLVCPHPGCGAKMDVELRVDEIPVEPRPVAPSYRVQLPDGPEVEVRLPRGRDLEVLSEQTEAPVGGAESLAVRLLAACLLRHGAAEIAAAGATEREDAVARLSPASRTALMEELERLSPRVEVDMETSCPECGRAFQSPLEPASLLIDEVMRGRRAFDREVHTLALHYHWSLREILGLTRPRRHRHLHVLAESLEAQAS